MSQLDRFRRRLSVYIPMLRRRARFRARWAHRRLSSPSRRNVLWRARMLRFLAIGLVGAVVLGILVVVLLVAWVASDLPDPSGVRRTQGFSTKITDRHGEVLYDVVNSERRLPVTIDNVPQYLQQATVAIEDKDFYRHRGFDPLTPLRIAYSYIAQGRLIGGSTLTQQLVKNALLSNERTITRKLREFILALEIERQFSKEEILQMYLNEAPYGGTAVGIGAAAEVHFNKPVSDLTLVESAILAGLPQRPTAYSPYLGRTTENGTPLWQFRTEGVLRRMREDGYITAELEKEALAQLPNVEFASRSVSIKAPHFVFYVQDKLEEMFGSEVVEKGGLTVTTTLDIPFQGEAQSIVAEELDKVKDFNITNGAAIAMDPRNGEILAMVGSKNYFADDIPGKFNVAVDGLRQPGSSIKPVTYVTAFKQGRTPATMLVDAPTVFAPNSSAQPYAPNNYDGRFRGPMSLRRALAESNNLVAVKLLAQVGVESMLETAFQMGFPTLEPTSANMSRFGLSVTLGGAEVHLIDTVTAYSAFANEGHRVEPISILEVKDSAGNVLFRHRNVTGQRVLTAEQTFLINSILSDDEARSGAFGRGSQLNIQNRPIAVKTGTTNDRRDNWTVGWSRSTIVGVWVGNNDNSAMRQVASGITGASPIWRRIMLSAIASGRTTDDFPVPDGVDRTKVDLISGWAAHDDFDYRDEWTIRGTVPTGPDPIHQKLRLCRDQDKLATAVDIQRGNWYERVFVNLHEEDPISQDGRNRWLEGINAWVATQPDQDRYRPPTEYCDSAREVSIVMRRPENERSYSETNIRVEVEAQSEERIERVEIYVNGSVRETLRERPYTTTLNLPRGRYTLYARAVRADGRDGKTGEVKIGTGGAEWQEPTPTPSPSPTPTPLLPIVTPSPSPTSSPGPSED